jgi:hypothetical protein
MAEERTREELDEEELDARIGAALPDRDLMTILPVPGAEGSEVAGLMDDCEPDVDETPAPYPPADTPERAEG